MPKFGTPSPAILRLDNASGFQEFPLSDVRFDHTNKGTQLTALVSSDGYPSTPNRTNLVPNPSFSKKVEPVANTYDKSDDKNTAIGQIKSSINKLECALFTRNRRMAETEREQDRLVAAASFDLDAALAQALQEDVTIADIAQHCPEHEEVLENRVNEIVGITALDMLDVLV